MLKQAKEIQVYKVEMAQGLSLSLAAELNYNKLVDLTQ